MTPEQVHSLTPKTRVLHSVFGWGTVVKSGDGGQFGYVQINFDSFGLKELAGEFAAPNLERDDSTVPAVQP